MKTLVYAARNNDAAVLRNSSSGGMFSALTEDFIRHGNAVVCVHYNYETDQAEFHLIESLEERDSSRGSLYIQSNAKDSWSKAYEWIRLHPDKELLFFGVGCQAAAFQKYSELKDFKDKVIAVDTICHGSPSPTVWKKYISFVKKEGILSDLNFRDKKTGWSHSIGTAKVDGTEVSIQDYRRLYSSRNTLRPCCSKCPYTRIDRQTDITIGDFWHIENSMPDFQDEKGVSLVIIHTEKGKSLFDSVSHHCTIRESNIRDCWQMNLEKPTEHAATRKQFWKDYETKDIQYIMKKYGEASMISKVKNIIKKSIGGGTRQVVLPNPFLSPVMLPAVS